MYDVFYGVYCIIWDIDVDIKFVVVFGIVLKLVCEMCVVWIYVNFCSMWYFVVLWGEILSVLNNGRFILFK